MELSKQTFWEGYKIKKQAEEMFNLTQRIGHKMEKGDVKRGDPAFLDDHTKGWLKGVLGEIETAPQIIAMAGHPYLTLPLRNELILTENYGWERLDVPVPGKITSKDEVYFKEQIPGALENMGVPLPQEYALKI